MRRIELHLKNNGTCDSVIAAIKHTDPVDYSILSPQQSDRLIINILVRDGNSQKLIDTIQGALDGQTDWRLNIIPIEASLPRLDEEDAEAEARNIQATREEIVDDVMRGAVLDRDFLVFVVLSTIVAAIGMNSGSPAAVIGAMVIAPLLGPILGFAMGAALGERPLLQQSALTLAVGIGVAFVSAWIVSLLVPVDLESEELISRARVRLDSLALALAAGGAAALTVAKGQGSALVGVMVAAALLPPGAAIGMFAGEGRFDLASRAALLLLLNVASLAFAALVTFRLRRIKPRSWIDQKNAAMAVWLNLASWVAVLILLGVLIVYFDLGAQIELP